MPGVMPGTHGGANGFEGFGVSKFSKQKDAAVSFIKTIAGFDVQKAMNLTKILPSSRVDKTIAVNLTSAITIVQTALPLLRAAAAADRRRGARVIALASITGVYAEPELAVYGATKAALSSLVRSVNREESAAGVCATATSGVAPWFSMSVPSGRYQPRKGVRIVVPSMSE